MVLHAGVLNKAEHTYAINSGEMGRGRKPCCQKVGLKKGPWSPAEDMKLVAYIQKYGHGNWRALPKQADIKRGNFSPDEEETIIKLHSMLGNKWSKIASRLPGRTDNEIKNVWNTYLKKRLKSTGTDTAVEEHKESLSSSTSSNSTITHCDQGEVMGQDDQIQPEFRCQSPPEVSGSLQAEENKEIVEGVIEIPVESNVDFWGLLDDGCNHLVENHDGSVLKESSSSSFNSVGVCSNHAGGKGQGDQAHPLFLSVGPNHFDDTLLRTKYNEGHMEEFPELPFEPNLDFWGVLEGDSSAFPSAEGSLDEPQACQGTDAEAGSSREVDRDSWITYLEKELELWAGGDENHPSAMEASTCSGLVEAENDPVTAYFQTET
ncbi:hypothetical protein ACLOJK_021580 [Asimina triloba]